MMPAFDTALLRNPAERHQPLTPQERKATQLPRTPVLRWLQGPLRRRSILHARLHPLPKYSRRKQVSVSSPS